MDDIKRKARIAGAWYVLMGLTAPIGLLWAPGQLLVRGDAAATAERLRASEWVLRAGIASELVHQAVAVFLVLALFRLFKEVDEHLAWHLVCLGALVSVPIMFLNVLNELAALVLAGSPAFLAGFDRGQLDGLAYLFMRLHGQGITLASVFWGLWLFPFGLLVVRSGFIPPVLGVLLLVAGGAYLAGAVATLVLPRYAPAVNQVASVLEVAEVPIILWLAIRGARPGAVAAVAPGSAA